MPFRGERGINMKFNKLDTKRLLPFFICLTIILSILTGCNQGQTNITATTHLPNQENEITDYDDNSSTSSQGISANIYDQDFSMDFESEIEFGEWDMSMPYINPFGKQEAYEKIQFGKNQKFQVSYVDDTNNEVVFTTFGDFWRMKLPWGKNKTPLDLVPYVKKINGDILYNDGGKMVFRTNDNEGNSWYAHLSPQSYGYLLDVVKELCLEVDKSMTIKTDQCDKETLRFVSYNLNSYMQSLSVSIPAGEIQLAVYTEYKSGSYTRKIKYHKFIYSKKTSNYILDGIPQQPGAYYYEIKWTKKNDPGEISFALKEPYPLEPVKLGEKLGAIRVRGSSYGAVMVEPSGCGDGSVYLKHPDLNDKSIRGDITPEGDTLFWVPSGYWNIFVKPSDDSAVQATKTQLVPVNSGEVTVVDMPASLQTVFEKNSSKQLDKGLVIQEAAEGSGTGTITFTLVDQETKDILPDNDNTEIFEGGKLTKILSIERVKVPPSIVLLLDSSGSMRGQMDKTVKSAQKFIEGLTDDVHIQVIDFDTKPVLLKGTRKSEVLKSLSKVEANGATALYDSVIEGLKLLENKQRPTLVVFTDGVDANNNDTGPGSRATQPEVYKAVAEAGIPLFTIGFGAKHDGTVLNELAKMSGGSYYPAEDQSALEQVFAAINNKLGSTFQAVYERPEKIAPSDVPVASVVIDTSGSMDLDPATEKGCGYRIDKIKNVFHDFVLNFPEDSLMQLLNFNSKTQMPQLVTANKAELLKALGDLDAGGGTEILGSVTAAYDTLKNIASTKKVIIYVTDAALKVDSKRQAQFKEILNKIKEDNIRILWVGLGLEEDKAVFENAALLSGGSYVISEDYEVLKRSFEEQIAHIKNKADSGKIALRLNVKKRDDKGENHTYTASHMVDFSAPKNTREKLIPETVSYRSGEKLVQYDEKAASLIYGTDMPSENISLNKRIPLDVDGSNKAVNIKAVEAFYLSKIKGVSAPKGKRFLAVFAHFKNILPEQEVVTYPDGSSHPSSWVSGGSKGKKTVAKIPYMIPDITTHFFVTVNRTSSYPMSPATWLAESPIVNPGENSLIIKPDEDKKGVLLFVVPDEPTEQMSVHYYDTAFGHIDIPLIGKMEKRNTDLKTLPKSAPQKLSDAFSINISAVSDVNKIEEIEASNQSTFRVVEASLTSNVQALLDIDPKKRLLLSINTDKGPYLIEQNPVTALMPMGFNKPAMMAPGSYNMLRFVYQIPKALADKDALSLYIDLRNEDISLPLNNKKPTAKAMPAKGYAREGATLYINSLSRVDKIDKALSQWVVADITVEDKKDGFASRGVVRDFILARDDYKAESPDQKTENQAGSAGLGNLNGSDGKTLIKPDIITDKLILGFCEDTVVYDGTSRRGLVVFKLPSDAKDHTWTLKTSAFSDLELRLTDSKFDSANILALKTEYQSDETFEKELSKALSKVVNEYNALEASVLGSMTAKKMDMDSATAVKNTVPVPATSTYGVLRMQETDTLAELEGMLKGLMWLPSKNDSWKPRYSPEAVVTQGWGTQFDIANLAEKLLIKLGYQPVRRFVTITPKGLEELKRISGIDTVKFEKLPVLSYEDSAGMRRALVIPLMKDVTELSGLVYMPREQDSIVSSHETVSISVKLIAESLNNGHNAQLGNISGSLSGGDSSGGRYEVQALKEEIPLDALSLDSVDIGYCVTGKETGDLMTAIVSMPSGTIVGNKSIDTGLYKVVGVAITIDGSMVHEKALSEDEDLGGLFHTLAINLPDLKKEAADYLQKLWEKNYKSAKNPDELSSLKWYTRNIINRFLTAQTQYERELSKGLKLVIGRTQTVRCFVVTVSKDNGGNDIKTSIDLLKSENQAHTGSQEAKSAFYILSGLNATTLEDAALPGNKHLGILDIWGKMPQDSRLIMLSPKMRKENIDQLHQKKYPEILIKEVEGGKHFFIVPEKPSIIDGKERWAWFRIDPVTYHTKAVLDTGENGSMVEFSLGEWKKDAAYFFFGAFSGIDASVWSVCSFSMFITDYEEMKTKAKQFAMGISEGFNYENGPVNYSVGSIVGFSKSFNNIQIGFNGKLEVTPDVLGFSNGYKAGVEYYFRNMK